MNFGIVRVGDGFDMKAKYMQVANEFCVQYYTLYDRDVDMLRGLCGHDVMISYMGKEFVGAGDWMVFMKREGFNWFVHNSMDVNVMPVSEGSLIVVVVGVVKISGMVLEHKFVETILLKRDMGVFYVGGIVFKLID